MRLSSGAVSLLLLPAWTDEESMPSLLAGCAGAGGFSLAGVGAGVNAVPHSMQNFATGRLIVPQFGQTTRRFPHSRQNFAVGGFTVWQFGQRITLRLLGRLIRRPGPSHKSLKHSSSSLSRSHLLYNTTSYMWDYFFCA